MGFRWSRYNEAWQRHLNNAGRAAADYVKLLKKYRNNFRAALQAIELGEMEQ